MASKYDQYLSGDTGKGATDRARALTDKYSSILAQPDRDRAQVNMLDEPQPDVAARARRYETELGVPAPVAAADIKGFDAQARQRKVASAIDANPSLAGIMANPFKAMGLYDDLDQMMKLATAAKTVPARNVRERIGTFFGQGVMGLYAGLSRFSAAQGAALDALTPDFLETDVGEAFKARQGQWANATTRASEDYAARPVAGETTWETVKSNPTPGNVAKYMLESTIRSVPGTVTAVAAAPLFIASASGSIGQQRAQNNGRDEADLGDVLIASPFAAGSAAMERLGIERIFGAEGANFALRIAKAGGGEAATEFVQGGIEYAGGTLGTDKGFDPATALDQAVAGAVAGFGMGAGLRSTVEAAEGTRKALNGFRDGQTIETIMGSAEKHASRTRDPETFREFVAAQTEDTPAENVYVPVEAVETLLQSGNLTEDEQAVFGRLSDQIAEARQTGGDIVIPMADAATLLAGTKAWEALKDDARIDAGGLSPREAREQSAQIEATLEQRGAEIIGAASDEIADQDPAVQVYSETRQQLIDAGFTPDAANKQAAIFAANREAWGKRLGMTATEYHAANPVEFRRELAGIASADNAMLDQRPGLFDEILAAAKTRKALAADLASAGRPVRMSKADGRYALASEDVSAPGGYRLTRFDENGPVGHTEHATLQEAIDEGLKDKFAPLNQAPNSPPGWAYAQMPAPIDEPPLSDLPASSPGPFAPARYAARRYMREVRRLFIAPREFAKVDKARAKRIAAAYDEMQHAPNDPEVRAAYDAMVVETLAQWETIKATGLKVEFAPPADPYDGNPWGAVRDVRDNNHLYVFSTEEGYGQAGITEADEAENPMLAVVPGENWYGKSVRVNDIFRAVHDYFGHIKEGVGFRARGEENAWRMHSAMYSPLARRAMTTETRGQNSWLNYGPNGEANQTASVEDTIFAEQKIGLLPLWVSEEGVSDLAGQPMSLESEDTIVALTQSVDRALRINAPVADVRIAKDGSLLIVADFEPNPAHNAKLTKLMRDSAIEKVRANSAAVLGDTPFRVVLPGDKALAGSTPSALEAPPVGADGKIALQHFSSRDDLTVLDPTHWGTNANFLPPAERAQIGTAPPRTYFGIATNQPGGYVKEFGEGAAEYTARIDASALYDAAGNPDGFTGSSIERDRAVIEAGYLGYWKKDPSLGLVAVVFTPTEVEAVRGDRTFYQLTSDRSVYWHGSPSGDLRGGVSGLHLGTREAARQALEARIGIPAEGEWDGSREYGKTKLAGRKTQARLKAEGRNVGTGQNAGAPDEDYFPPVQKYADGSDMPMSVKPDIRPFRLNAEMSNTRSAPHEDFKANGYMKANIKKGKAKRGFYYANVGEDAGSISVVVPNGDFVIPAEDVEGEFPLFQTTGKPRGQIQFTADGRSVITLFEDADLSTLLHETGHLFFEELKRNALTPNAPADVVADWNAIKKWLKENGQPVVRNQITREGHELMARGFERYLMEGKAPSRDLAGAFATFRSWLVRIYQVVQSLRSPITPEVRAVFDRMLATQQAIDEYAGQQNQVEIDEKSATAMGMTGAEFVAYRESVIGAKREAYDTLLKKTMHAIRVRETKRYKDAAKGVREDVTASVYAEPRFIALRLLRTGRWLNDENRPAQKMTLDREWLIERFGATAIEQLPKGPMIVKTNGDDADTIAEQVGFGSGEAMVRALFEIETEQQALRLAGDKRQVMDKLIDDQVEAIMAQRTEGDALTDGSLEEEAIAALNGEQQGAVLSTELRYLARRTRASPTPYRMAREWAARKIRAGRVNDVASRAAMQRYSRASAKAAKLAEEAIIAGDYDEAFRQKQAQMLNHALLAEAKAAGDEIDVIVKRMNRLASRATMASVDQDYMDRIHDLLEKYDFRPKSQRWLNEVESFARWAAKQAESGYEVLVPERLLGDGQHYSRISVDTLFGLRDAVGSLLKLGKLKQSIIDAQKERAFSALIDEIEANIAALPGRKQTTEINDKDRMIASAVAPLIKIETLADDMDLGNPNGPMNRLLVQRATQAENRREELRDRVTKRIAQAYLGMDPKARKRLEEKVTIPEWLHKGGALDERNGQPVSMTRMELLSIALNTGNQGNLEKLARGEGWPVAAIQTALRRELSKSDWDFVQDVWDAVDSLWPDIAAAERNLSGVVPEKVMPLEVDTPFGAYRGGYYPVVYDPNRSGTAEKNADNAANDLFGMASGVATPKGHTITRTAAVGPILRSVEGVLFGHIEKVVTRIAYAEYARDVLRVIQNPKVRNAMDLKLGREYRRQIKPWLQRQISGGQVDPRGLGWWEKFSRSARTNMSIVAMGLRWSTGVAQIAGLTSSAARVGAVPLANGMRVMLKNPAAASRFVFRRSPEMAKRNEAMNREVAEFFREVRGKNTILNRARGMAFWHIGMIDRYVVSIPTWLAAHSTAIGEGMTDAQASAVANKAVRQSQGSGREKDMANWQSPPSEPMRWLTLFYTYFNVVLNAQWETGRAAKRGDWRKAASLSFWFLVAAPLADALLSGDLPDPDDEDETWEGWAGRNLFFNLWSGVPVARDLAAFSERKIMGEYATLGSTPIQRIEEVSVNAYKVADKLATEGELDDKWLKTAIETPGYFMGLPTGQPAATAQFLWDYSNGETDPQGFNQWYWGLTKGKVPDED